MTSAAAPVIHDYATLPAAHALNGADPTAPNPFHRAGVPGLGVR